MSSWIPSLFNPFSDDDNSNSSAPSSPNRTTPRSPSSGAKDDLSAVFRGVASFLAPPQTTLVPESYSSETIEGIKNDLAEIQGSFRSGLSLISSKFTSNFLQFQNEINDGDESDEEEKEEEEEGDEAVGINEEIVDFVWKISGRSELWTDFPLSLPDDFDLSVYQREHAANIGHLVSELVALRQKISSQISDGKFWLIYFILLLPRLNEEDLKLLSTPQVAEARETLLKKLQNKIDEDQETSEDPELFDSNKESGKKNNTEGGEKPSEQKDVLAETVNPKQKDIVNETESGYHSEEVITWKQSENEEDVSFSDLEDDDDDDDSDKLSGPKESKSDKVWVQLNENSGAKVAKQNENQSASRDKESEGEEESNDWLTVDDTDFDNLAAI